MKRFLALVLALISLNACSLYKKYERELVAEQDLFGEINLADSNSLATLPWKEVFTDPCLQELIDTALSRNSDLLSAQHNVQEAMQRLKVARLGYLPSLNVGAQANWSSLSAPSWSIAGTASWQIDLFGAQTNVKRQSEANLEWSEDYKLAVQSSLIAALASNYYSLQVLDAELEIAAQTSGKFQESVRVLKAMKEAGMANEIAVAQMEAAYHEVNSAQKDLQESIVKIENSICSLCRQAPGHIIRKGLGEFLPTMPEGYGSGLAEEVLSNRPDVKAAEMNLASAYYQLKTAKAALLPSVKIDANLALSFISAIGSLIQPIFNSGALIAQVKVAEEEVEKAKLAYEQCVLDAGGEVNSAWNSYCLSKERLQDRQSQAEALELALSKSEVLLKYSSGTYLDVLTAQQSLLSAKSAICQEMFNSVNSLIQLYLALGGGCF